MNLTNKPVFQTFASLALLLGTAAPASASSLIYIPMGGENNILIVENDGGEIIGKIDNLPSVHGLAGTPNGKFLVAASYEERDKMEGAPAKPEGVSAADHALHHPNQGGENAPKVKLGDSISTVSIISTKTNEIIRAIDVPGSVHHVAISPDGKYAVVTHTGFGTVSIIDLATYELSANISTGDMPNYASFSPDSKKLYVSNSGNDTISIVDIDNEIVERNIIVGEQPEHMALSSDGAILYVANVSSGSVSIVDVNIGKVTKTIDVGETLHGLDFSDDGKSLIVAVRDGEALVSINVDTFEKTQTALAPSPYHITNIVGTNEIYVSSADAPTVFIVDENTLEKLAEIGVGARAHQMVQVKYK